MRIQLFDNGLNSAFEDGEQVPMAQKPWLIVFAEYLESVGIDPTKQEIKLPDGRKAQIFSTEEGFNWSIEG